MNPVVIAGNDTASVIASIVAAAAILLLAIGELRQHWADGDDAVGTRWVDEVQAVAQLTDLFRLRTPPSQ